MPLNDEKVSMETLEQKKLEMEIKSIQDERKRRWLVGIALIVGVLSTLSDISKSYEEKALNTRMETTKIFLNDIIPLIQSSTPSSEQAIKKSSYYLSVGLADNFSFLKDPILSLLCSNANNGDIVANKLLETKYKGEECK